MAKKLGRACAVSFVLTAIFFGSAVAGAQTEEAVAQARFNKGARALHRRTVRACARRISRSEHPLPSESPNTRLYIARCERELGHNAAAFIELGRAANEAADRSRADPRYTSTRDVAKQEASALEPKLAHVTVIAPNGMPEGATITVNGEALNAAAVGVAAPIDPGPIEVVASAAGYVTEKKSTRAAAGEAVEIKLRLEKDPNAETAQTPVVVTTTNPTTNATTATIVAPPVHDESPRASHGLRNAGFVVGGIGIAGMGVFGVFAGLAQTRYDQLKTQCGGPCDPSYNSRINEGAMFASVANVALAAGGGLILTGAIMIIAGISTGKSTPPVQASFAPLPNGGWIGGVSRAF